MRSYVTEFIGTFFLVLTIGLTVLGKSPMAPLAIGASLMIMVYMGGHISGGHYNPAVSLAVLMRGAMAPADFIPYLVAQCAGAFAAAFITCTIMGTPLVVAPGPNVRIVNALLVEFLYTFALALVVLQTATNPKTDKNSFYGLAIGFTVVVAAFAGGGISGGAFNPAVGLGPILMDTIDGGSSIKHLWIYLVGPLAGGAAAALIYKLQDSPPVKPIERKA